MRCFLLLALVALAISQVQATTTCTGSQTTGVTLTGPGANACFTVTTSTINVGSSSGVNVPVQQFDTTKGTLVGVHIIDGGIDLTSTATYSTNVAVTGFSVNLISGTANPYITIQESVTNTYVAKTNTLAQRAAMDAATAGVFFDGTDSPVSTGGINAGSLSFVDNTYSSTGNGHLGQTLNPGTTATFTSTDATTTQSWDVASTSTFTGPNDILISNAANSGGYTGATLSGFASSGGVGTWNLICTTPAVGFALSGAGATQTGTTITVNLTPSLLADFTIQYDYIAAVVTGDPQIVGFQGQKFQIHGTPDEYYNLVSATSYFINSKFVYMATGVCNYNDTECFSHPGTYIGEVSLVTGVDHVKVSAGPHARGLTVFINDKIATVGVKVRFDNDTYVHVVSASRVVLRCVDLKLSIVNSDSFLNLGVDFTNGDVLRSGHAQVVIPGSASAAAADKLISKAYPEFAMHGLLGQTWRNVQWPHARLYQGEPADYQVSSLYNPEFLYTQYSA